MAIENEEIIKTTEPKKSIVCKDCKHRLKEITIGGEKIFRYTYGTCAAFENKPDGVLWNGENCELYAKDEANEQS